MKEAVSSFFSNYANFSGRSSVSDYWWVVLFSVLVGFVCVLVGAVTKSPVLYLVLVSLYSLGTIIPSLALIVRRLHDTGRGGGWIFISLVPFIGAIWLLVLMIISGQPMPNRFGPSPASAKMQVA